MEGVWDGFAVSLFTADLLTKTLERRERGKRAKVPKKAASERDGSLCFLEQTSGELLFLFPSTVFPPLSLSPPPLSKKTPNIYYF